MELLFWKRILVLASVVAAFIFILQIAVAPLIRDQNTYVAATIDKQERLRSTASPRIIFVGGSNLAFGVDSKRVQDSIGMTVVNMGLHGGLGLNYILNETIDNIRPNDLIVICTEYFLAEKGSLKLLSQLRDVNPDAAPYTFNSFPDYLRLYVCNIQRCTSGMFYKLLEKMTGRTLTEAIYLRNSFSVEGDNISHLNQPRVLNISMDERFNENYTAEIVRINRFVDIARSKRCKVVYVFPNIPRTFYKKHFSAINAFEMQLRKGLTCEILGRIETFVLPDNMCFDSIYHLTYLGRQRRTDRLIPLLRSAK